ncbi:MAG TPA: single-stranded-DNA-specific exonuclease RecJ [Chitinophagales bacterium]|nr:single-stranded-DNA-specific exonuclease RecJ [Chitinophagales bacterium]
MSDSLIVTPKFKNWFFLQPNEAIVQSLHEELNIHISICRILVLRGVKNKEDAERFFNPSLADLHDPFLMKDMDIAVERIHQAILKKEKILIYGDYDVDGITAVSMLYTFFRNFYDNISFYVPDRNKEGCGISYEGIDFAREDSCKLIIALDCGVKDHDKVSYARKNGVEIIICDHHLPDLTLPSAVAVLDPKRPDCNYPFKELSGCGVGFKLLQAYTQRYPQENSQVENLLDFVVVSIAADTVSVTGENRILAHHGMKLINGKTRVGFKAILDIVNSRKKLELMDLVFTISPRINAAGRILHASYAVELLIERDKKFAKIKAQLIHDNNSDRQVIDKDITTSALDIIEDDDYVDKKAIVIYQPDWHQGVIAIVASRLVEQFHKPTLILTESNGLVVGSGRSVPGFDLHEAINACSEYVIQFGGHKYAAGLSMEKQYVEEFIEAFENIVEERILEEQLEPKIEIDAIVELDDINEEFYSWIEKMAPFGSGNHKPIFVTKDVKDTGNNGFVGKSHLKLHVSKFGQAPKSGIGFGMWDYIPYLRNKGVFDICYQMYMNEWNGQKNIEIRLKDLK